MEYVYIIAILIIVILVLITLFTCLVKLFKKGHLKTIVVILLALFLSYKIFQYYRYAAVLPSQIEITYPVSNGEESGLFGGDCGVAVFKVSDKTIKAIQKTKLKFFDEVTQGRGFPEPKELSSFSSRNKRANYDYYTYKPWKETPVPESWWIGTGSWFVCSAIRDSVARDIIKSAKLPGSFYTTKQDGQLVVIPSLGYIVFSYYND